MRSKSFFGLLFVFSLVSLWLLPSTWVAMADPPHPLERQIAPLQPAASDQDVMAAGDVDAMATMVFYPTDDAPVREGTPDATAPDELALGAGYDDGYLYGSTGRVRSYLRFDLSGLPTVGTIASATLRLYHAGGADFPGISRDVSFYRVTDDWNEAIIAWNNRPGYAEAVGSVSTTYNYVGWLSLDVTDQVRAWVDGSHDNYGLVAIGPESIEGIYRVFASGEEVHRPELHIHFSTVPPPVLDVSPGTLSVKASDSKQLSVQVSNVTTDTLDWTATKLGGATWLTLDSSSGSVTPTTPDNLDLTVDPTVLTAGNVYTEQIRISSDTSGVVGSPLTVTVTLEAFDSLSQIYLPVILKNSTGTGDSGPPIVVLAIGISDYLYLEPPSGSGDLPDDPSSGDLFAPDPYDLDDVVGFVQTELTVPAVDIFVLRGSNATKANTVATIENVKKIVEPGTLFWLYYSGHGGQVTDLDGDEDDERDEFIAMYEVREVPGGYEGVLTDDELRDLLADVKSRRTLIVIDACYSGGMACCSATQTGSGDLRLRGLVNPFLGPSEITAQAALHDLVGPGRVVITAGSGDQSTWESESLENGVFTYFFLQALEDALHDANQNNRISAEEAYWFSRDVVDAWVLAHVREHQNPCIRDEYFGQVDLTWLP